MMGLNKLSEFVHYYIDSVRSSNPKIFIDYFEFSEKTREVFVIYRIGRKRNLLKMEINAFEENFFSKVSKYDQNRLTKFTAYQKITEYFKDKVEISKAEINDFIAKEANHEPLF